MATDASSLISVILMFLTPTIWSTSKLISSNIKATRPRRFCRLIAQPSQIFAGIGQCTLDRRGRDRRRAAQMDFRTRTAHAAAHVERAGRHRTLLVRHRGDTAEAIVAGGRGHESPRFGQ